MVCVRTLVAASSAVLGISVAHGEVIGAASPVLDIVPGQTRTALIVLKQSATPLFGYSLDLRISPNAGAAGSAIVVGAQTNFFDSRNLITAGGFTRDPLFSVILPNANGVFISTNIAGGGAVLSVPGVNDVLAEVAFAVSGDAEGIFVVTSGPGSALSDERGFSVAFSFESITINVVPAPGTLAVLIPLNGWCLRRRRSRRV